MIGKNTAEILFPFFFLTMFTLFLFRVYPSVPPEDSGELITAAETLSIAHPSGYPLFCITGRIFSLFLQGNPSYRQNVFSAFLGALSILLALKICLLLFPGKILPGLFAATLLFFSPVFTELSVLSEVYMLNCFLILIFVYSVISSANICLIAFLAGIGMTNHLTFVLAIFCVLLILFITRDKLLPDKSSRHTGKYKSGNYIEHSVVAQFIEQISKFFYSKSGQAKALPYIVIVFIAALSVYLYLPLRSMNNPAQNWGQPGKSIENTVNHILRKDYGTTKLSKTRTEKRDLKSLITQSKGFIRFLNNNIPPVAVFTGISGLFFVIFRIKRAQAKQSHEIATTDSNRSRNDMARRKNAILLLFLLFLAYGAFLAFLSNMPFDEWSRHNLSRIIAPSAVFLILSLACFFAFLPDKTGIAMFVLCLMSLFSFRSILPSGRNNFLAFDYARNIMQSIEPGSILLTIADTSTFTVMNQQETEKIRRDIYHINVTGTTDRLNDLKKRHPELFSGNKPIPASLSGRTDEVKQEVIKNNYGKRKIYTEGIHAEFQDLLIPYGFVNLLSADTSDKAVFEKGLSLFPEYVIRNRKIKREYPVYYDRQVLEYYSAALYNISVFSEYFRN